MEVLFIVMRWVGWVIVIGEDIKYFVLKYIKFKNRLRVFFEMLS